MSDISQRKRLEEQLLHAQKMEAVGRLAGGIAHDFNNVLTIISGYNHIIRDKLPPSDPLRSHAEEALKAAERAGALTKQLLAFSRRQVLKPRIINVNKIKMGGGKEERGRVSVQTSFQITAFASPSVPVTPAPGGAKPAGK